MTTTPVSLQDLRRRIYVMANGEVGAVGPHCGGAPLSHDLKLLEEHNYSASPRKKGGTKRMKSQHER